MMAAPDRKSAGQDGSSLGRVFSGMRSIRSSAGSGYSEPARPGPSRRRRIYLSSAFGFAECGRYALDRLRAELESLGLEVWEPFRECAGQQPREAGMRRLAGMRECDGLFAVVNGNPDDIVMTEIGYAAAFGKRVFLFRDDTRTCGADFPLNIVVQAGLPEDWKNHWYTGVAELGDTGKALARWAGRAK